MDSGLSCATLASISHMLLEFATPSELCIYTMPLLVCTVRDAVAARIALHFNHRCIEGVTFLSSLDLLSQPDQLMQHVIFPVLLLLAGCRTSGWRLLQQFYLQPSGCTLLTLSRRGEIVTWRPNLIAFLRHLTALSYFFFCHSAIVWR